MSSKALDWAFRQSLKPVTKAVLVAMADTADDDGYLFPSYEYLIYKTDVSQRTLVAAVKELVVLGLVISEKNYRDGYRLANLFFLMLDNKDMMKPAWTGKVSTKARKAQLEDFRGRSAQRRESASSPSTTASTEAHDSGSAETAPTVLPAGGGWTEGDPASTGKRRDVGSAGTAYRPSSPRVSGSAGSALTVSGCESADHESPVFPVVQDLHLGGPYVQNLQSVSANSAHAPLKEPHDDLSHHQSARDYSPPTPSESAVDRQRTMIDDSLIHSGVNLKSLAARVAPVLETSSPDRLRWVVDEALSKAKCVSNPLAFVVKCVQNDPERFTTVPAVRAANSGGLLGPGDEPCPKTDHGQYRAVNCPACRVEARIITAGDDESQMSSDELTAWRERRANRVTDRRGRTSTSIGGS